MSSSESQVESIRHRLFKRYPAYKDSGVEWLGEIPAHWGLKRLKFVAPPRISKLDTKPGDTIYVGLEHVESWTGRLMLDKQPESVDSVVASFKAGDVLFGKLRPYLAKAARPNFDGVCTSEIVPLRPLAESSQSYLMYFLLNVPYIRWLDSLTYGTKMPRVSPEQIGGSFVSIPYELEQRAIAAFLDRETARIDALVSKKERLIELLQEKRTALITRAVTKGLDPNVPMKGSGVEWLGEIPAHWEVKRLKYVVPALTVGIVVTPAKYYEARGIPCLRSFNIASGSIVAEDLVFISPARNDLHTKSKLRAGDLVVVRTGITGTSAVVPLEFDGANCIDLLIIRRSKQVNSQFLWYFINSKAAARQIAEYSEGAIQAHYNTSTLGNLVITVPFAAEQTAIELRLDYETARLDKLIAKVREAIDRLRELRTALISAAVTGEIDVREEVA
jgi:type I restriction enzyme, S subunit